MKHNIIFFFLRLPLAMLYTGSLTVLWIVTTITLCAQGDIPIGEWRTHISYASIEHITHSSQKIFGASRHGLVVFDKTENSLSTLTKLNGLTTVGISALAYHESTQQLLIAYEDGRFDVVKENTITPFSPTQTSTLTGSKKINHITTHQGLAYLSTDYGILIFDLTRSNLKETWRDLGRNGSTLKINATTFFGDSIYAATAKGIIAGRLSDNLLDYANWKREDSNDFDAEVLQIATFNNAVYATLNNLGIYKNSQSSWILQDVFQGSSFTNLIASTSSLFILAENKIWTLNNSDILEQIESPLLTKPQTVTKISTNEVWIGDGTNGLVSNVTGSFSSYLPNGPRAANSIRLVLINGQLVALSGGFTVARQPNRLPGYIDFFDRGSWSTSQSVMEDLTDIASTSENKFTISSFGFGIEERNEQGALALFDETNSTLINTNSPTRSVNVTALAYSPEGSWVANYGAASSLHLLTTTAVWEAFSFPINSAQYPLDLAIDFSGNIWMVLDPLQGGGLLVFNKLSGESRYLTDAPGAGGLPSRNVRSITVDRTGSVWIGTDRGVAYFLSGTNFFGTSVNAIRPIFENRFLLQEDRITALAIDGGNRKWMGTERGVWLFNATGEELIQNFTIENSPLLANGIQSIKVDPTSGEVFFATTEGIISYRSNATVATSAPYTVKIFPNPVTQNFRGEVGINGLPIDAVVKITDIRGKLVWQTQANGGSTSWNVMDYTGKKVSTGMYIVFCATADGNERTVGKIAVVD